MTETAVPEGFQLLKRVAPFLEMVGPIYVKSVDRSRIIAIRVAEKHLNMRGIVHGGMLITLADSALGINLSYHQDPPRPMVTVSLSTDFLEPAMLGDWVEAHVRVQRTGMNLAFANCTLQVGTKAILRSSGVFFILPGTTKFTAQERFDG
ncbi:MAG: PaaI family thioesterase [Sulfurifustaceae bacterium]